MENSFWVGVSEISPNLSDALISDKCIAALEKVLVSEKIDREMVRMLMLSTDHPDFKFPSTAFLIQKELGLSCKSAVFDIRLQADEDESLVDTMSGMLKPCEDKSIAILLHAYQSSNKVFVLMIKKDKEKNTLLDKDVKMKICNILNELRDSL